MGKRDSILRLWGELMVRVICFDCREIEKGDTLYFISHSQTPPCFFTWIDSDLLGFKLLCQLNAAAKYQLYML